MKMLKKHYEKFIFIFLLLISLILFGLQVLSVIEEKPPQEKFFAKPDYKSMDMKADKYNNEKQFADKSGNTLAKKAVAVKDASKLGKDKASEKGKPGRKYVETANLGIDLLQPPVLAKCPSNSQDQQHFIPITDFPLTEDEIGKKKCSYCNTPLEHIPPEQIVKEEAKVLTDTDNDGIPDDEEIKAGLNPQNPNDADKDLDKDGFTNLEEYRMKTAINNPKSRPSYATKLFVQEVEETPIGITVFRFINDKDKDKPDKWTVHFTSETIIKKKTPRGKDRISKKTYKVKIGKDLKKAGKDAKDYVLESITPKFTSKEAGEEVNVSIVTLKLKTDDPKTPAVRYTATIGQEFIDPKKRVTYELDMPADIRKELKVKVNDKLIDNDKPIVVMIGDTFTIGNEFSGVETLITVSAEKVSNSQSSGRSSMRAKLEMKSDKGSVFFDVNSKDANRENNPENPGAEPRSSIEKF
ncbi:MAG: hypothetical protein E7040_01085 [Lentisphaerae bacterium]|nr:hypothetical protein [Lentisphaerota bacterium]